MLFEIATCFAFWSRPSRIIAAAYARFREALYFCSDEDDMVEGAVEVAAGFGGAVW